MPFFTFKWKPLCFKTNQTTVGSNDVDLFIFIVFSTAIIRIGDTWQNHSIYFDIDFCEFFLSSFFFFSELRVMLLNWLESFCQNSLSKAIIQRNYPQDN